MSREVKVGDKIMVTRVNGVDLGVPHIATVKKVEEGNSELRTLLIEHPILGERALFVDVPEEDSWTLLDEREVEVGDKITVLKYNGESTQRDAEVTEVNTVTIDVQFCDSGEEAVLYKHPSELDEWHFLDDDITLDASSYDEEETLQQRQTHAYYDDEALSPSYSEAVKAGMTFADYTGVSITKESLDFEPKEEEVLRGITAESLNFEEAPKSDAVNHPSHYGKGRFETIEMIEEITKGYDDGFVAHCVGTAVKYESRAPFKHDSPLEDLRKARKYLEFAIEHLERMEGE